MRSLFFLCGLLFVAVSTWAQRRSEDATPLAGTAALSLQGDIASNLVAGVDRFLQRELDASIGRRAAFWKRDFSSAENYIQSIEPNRKRLAHILGLRDERPQPPRLEFVAEQAPDLVIARGDQYEVFRVRWSAFADVHGDGLLLRPNSQPPKANIIALPDADLSPEQMAGLADGIPPAQQFARRLAENGCQVLIPVLINRSVTHRKLSNREFLYRSAFELGRHIIGYEVQKVLAAVDWFTRDPGNTQKVGVIGWGEGGMIALYAAALDSRIQSAAVSGYFDSRQHIWEEPIYRNVFGLLEQFGDAELAGMIVPGRLIIEAAKGPEVVVPTGTGGGPGRLTSPALDSVQSELARAREWIKELPSGAKIELVVSGDGSGPYGTDDTLRQFLNGLSVEVQSLQPGQPARVVGKITDVAARQQAQMQELDRHNQWALTESSYVRKEFFSKLDTSSLPQYEKTIEPYRDFFHREVIGKIDERPLPPNVRSRKAYDETKWTGYEVVLDVFPDVIAYGILLVPKDLSNGQKRPLVVCQHGLEGRPEDTIGEKSSVYYAAFAARLAERGFITFAPQNLYIFTDRFRTLQRKANPLKKTLFSVIVPQHQQIVDWLKTLPFVDPDRIAFYGLSYGGKTAMRVPPLVKDYCLSICSADFNEWVWKNASSRSPYSYVWTGEYEIFEFDLGSTFNYAEMAALIAPRPFMVERGHNDTVAPDETVGYEFAKVRSLYNGKLGIGNRCEIEWFAGPHTIHGVGTFEFLHRNLKWPVPK